MYVCIDILEATAHYDIPRVEDEQRAHAFVYEVVKTQNAVRKENFRGQSTISTAVCCKKRKKTTNHEKQ
jgi:hypothetical protein